MPHTRNQTSSTQDNPPDEDNFPDNSQPASAGIPVHQMTNEEELKRAQKIAANAVSSSYQSYHVPKLSSQKDNQCRPMIAYTCKMGLARVIWEEKLNWYPWYPPKRPLVYTRPAVPDAVPGA
ncbi:hypothetical protein PTTG_05689 [Puccinia triticina 1-1 BBBD Race 1]|uniref:Uncharacterized protein n=1 Tax=Puccinia triticina (isolate 1-1 / race 1 (BBBD)) TaxID=630390 RepID=A0A0C4EXZ0_PUCT1|nr:hypothetical protein PTTG_05689 [Puccinia triticina 1-1 BBBD Race 1]